MKLFNKILSGAVVATLAMSVVATSASAHNPNNHKSPGGIFPALFGPFGAGAAVGTSTSTINWTTTKMVPWSKTFTWTKKIWIPKTITKNTYWIQNTQSGTWHQAPTLHSYNTQLSTPNKIGEIRPVTKTIKVPKTITKTKTVSGQKKVTTKHSKSSKSTKNMGKAVVGCIMGSAFGAITASMRKATALGNPPRWRSQAEHERIVASGYEKQFELTNDEAQTALALCGLGSFALHWEKRAPVVKARY